MKFNDLINERQSVRKYDDKIVEREKIEECIKAAGIAPSACNSQPWKYIVVDEPELKNKVAKETFSKILAFNKFAVQAPVIVVVVVEKPNFTAKIGSWIKDKKYYLYDIGISVDHFCLKATEEGLGTCILGWYNEKPIKKLLGIPENKGIGLIITLGYPEKDYKQRIKIRKDLKEILSYNKYIK